MRTFAVDPALLTVGNNLLAVEVHRDRAHSSDLSMDADVIGTYPD